MKILVTILCINCNKTGTYNIIRLVSVLKQDIRCECGSISFDWRTTKAVSQ